MTTTASGPCGYVLADDLMFASRITATGRSLGLPILQARNVAILTEALKKAWPKLLILDLGHPELQVVELLKALDAQDKPRPKIVAYGSHVDAASLHAARAAGCDIVLPRSKFVEELPVQLSVWAGTPTADSKIGPLVT